MHDSIDEGVIDHLAGHRKGGGGAVTRRSRVKDRMVLNET